MLPESALISSLKSMEQTPTKEKESRKLTFGLIVSWIISVVMACAALGAYVGKMPSVAFWYLLTALAAFPPLYKLLQNKFRLHISRPLKFCLVVAAFVGSCVAMTMAAVDSVSGDSSQTNTGSSNTNTAASKTVPQYKVGDTFKDGDLNFVIDKVEDKGKEFKELDCQYYCSTITADGKFVLVTFTAQNTGTKPQDITLPNLVDKDGRVFQRSSALGNYGPSGYEEYEVWSSINPGNSSKYYIIYDVPTDSSGFKWQGLTGILRDNVAYNVDLGL